MLLILIGAGIYGRAHVGLLDADVDRQVGHSARLFFDGHWHRVLTSVFFTAGGWRFYSSLLMFAGTVGYVECLDGTQRTMLAFFGIHVATLLLLAFGITLPLAALETQHGVLLLHARDVGPSAGYYGCLGLLVARLASRIRFGIVTAIVVVLALRLLWSASQLSEEGRMLSADLAHMMALPLGLLCYAISARRADGRSVDIAARP